MAHHLIKHLVKNKAKAAVKAVTKVEPKAVTVKPPKITKEPVSLKQAELDAKQKDIEVDQERARNGLKPSSTTVFKTDALARSKAMKEAGYTMEGFPSVKTKTEALEAGYPAPKDSKIWDGDKASLKQAGQDFLDSGGNRQELKSVGVIPTTTNGRPDHLYNRKQGNLSIRGVAQEQNTKLNRVLNLVQQTDGPSTFKSKKSERPNYGTAQAEHHIRGAKQLDFLFEGADAKTAKKLSAYATEKMKPTGDSKYNNADLPKTEVHDPLHAWQKEVGLDPVMDTNLLKIFGVSDISQITYEQRKMALDLYLDLISGAQEEKIFELMQKYNRKKLKAKK